MMDNDFVSVSNRRQFVEQQLASYAGEKKELSGSALIICPFHSEKTPSGRIFHSPTTKAPGYFICYGCGKRSNWNELAPLIGLQPFTKQRPKEEFANFSLLPSGETIASVKSEVSLKQEEIAFSALPANKVWRSIKTNLLISIGAKQCRVNHEEHGWLQKKIYLPVLINKELRGYIKARLTKHADFPSYINASGSWSKTHGLFPYDYAIQMMQELGSTTMVLVEGPRDALMLLQLGIPAMCILGTQSFSATKAKLLELAGVEKVVLFMDGDCAGRAATQMLAPKLRHMFQVRIIKLWALKGSPYLQFGAEEEPSKAAKLAGVQLWDPGSCPTWITDKLKTTFFTKRK